MSDTGFELVVFDGDDTLVADDVIEALAERAGVADEIEGVHDRVWNGDLEPMEALGEQIFPLFEGLSAAAVQDVVEDRAFTPGAREVGRRVACDSAVFTSIDPHAERIAAAVGAEHYRANTPVMEDGRLTGELRGQIVEEGKGPTLDALLDELEVAPEATIVVGDGPQDVPMFERAGFAIGVDPKPAAREHVDVAVDERDIFLVEPYLAERGVLRAADTARKPE
ncbi:MAG: HAD family hydrolase [Halobacteriales archaeon]